MATLRRFVLLITLLGASVTAASPSIAATSVHSVPWAALGVVRPTLVQPSGWGSPIAAQPRNTTMGWCIPTGVAITAVRGRVTRVSDGAVTSMLARAHLALGHVAGSSAAAAVCGDVALDPRHPLTVYVAFQASKGGVIPPSYGVALVTTNLGKSWRFVPPPKGYTLTDFAGFVERPTGVEMLYESNYFFPLKPGQSTAFVAATSSTGGRTWTDVNLACPSGAPCVTFGPESPQGACGMSQWQQSVLVGTANEYRGGMWRAAGTVDAVNPCVGEQLVTTSLGSEFLIDRSRQSALLYTRDGIHWTAVSLPKVGGAPAGNSVPPYGPVMTITSTGALVAVTGSPFQTAEHLAMLKPQSNTWCATNALLPVATRSDPVVTMQSGKSALVITFVSPIATGGGTKKAAVVVPLATLRCRT